MKKQLINGQWRDALNGNTWRLINPATEEVLGEVPYGDAADCDLAIEAAVAAFPAWSRLTAYQRADILKKTADIIRAQVTEFGRETVLESGKTMAEAKGEWLVAANLFEWYAEEAKRSYGRIIPTNRADKRSSVIYQPIGVVGVITAWNFPAYNPARAWAASLAAGCTIVAKGSEFTPYTGMNLAWALQEAGIPDGVVNLLSGEAEPIGRAMLAHPKLRKISFTGSTRVGKFLMDGASLTHTKLSLELGGNAPVIICEDVDVEKVAKASVSAKFRNCGQVCVAPQRFLVQRSVYDRFMQAALTAIRAIKPGNGLEPDTRVGPLINKRQQEHVLDVIRQAREEGAEVLFGGEANEKGYFVTPCLMAVKDHSAEFLQREIFGPVMPVVPFDTREQAIEWANDSPYGLAAYVWTNQLQHAVELSEKLEYGIVGVNEWSPHGTELPFGGWKQSGIGHESGAEGLLEYMEKKLISMGV